MAVLWAWVIRGKRMPFDVEETSRIALVSAGLPVVLILTFCENAFETLKNKHTESSGMKWSFIIHINVMIKGKNTAYAIFIKTDMDLFYVK